MSAVLTAKAPYEAPRRTRGLYTYEIRPIGPVISLSTDGAGEELTMVADLVRLDGSSRRHTLRVRNTDRQPGLVDLVRQRLRSGSQLRMVVRFENIVEVKDDTAHMRVEAIADTLLDLQKAGFAVQLDLFG